MMCYRPRKLALAAALALLPLSYSAQSETLRDIYELALENDAQLKAQAAQYRADLQLEEISFAALLPQVTAGYGISNREIDNTRPTIIPDGDGGFAIIDGNTLQDTDTDSWDVRLPQQMWLLPGWWFPLLPAR